MRYLMQNAPELASQHASTRKQQLNISTLMSTPGLSHQIRSKKNSPKRDDPYKSADELKTVKNQSSMKSGFCKNKTGHQRQLSTTNRVISIQDII